MEIDWFTFVAQVVNFLILIALLQRFLYKPVIKAMDEREQKVASELEEARRKKVEAEQKEQELDKKHKDFESEKGKLMAEARREVDNRRQDWMEQLRREISDVRSRWIEALESEKESFLNNLKEETADRVIHLMGSVLSDLSEQNLQQQTVDFFDEKIATLGKEDTDRLQKTLRQLNTVEAEIRSSFELNEKQKHRLENKIRQIAGVEMECTFDTSERLGFGLELRIGGWRLGWNLKSYLEKLRGDMDQFLKQEIPVRQTLDMN